MLSVRADTAAAAAGAAAVGDRYRRMTSAMNVARERAVCQRSVGIFYADLEAYVAARGRLLVSR